MSLKIHLIDILNFCLLSCIFSDFPSERLCCLNSGGLFHSISCHLYIRHYFTRCSFIYPTVGILNYVHFFCTRLLFEHLMRIIFSIFGYALKSMLYHKQVEKCTEVKFLGFFCLFVLFFCLCKLAYLTQKFRNLRAFT